MHDFATVIPRRGTGSLKWDLYAEDELLPLWVADMDFPPPPVVLEALHARIDHGIFGYAIPTSEDNRCVADYCARRYDWAIEPQWVTWSTGLGFALHLIGQVVCDSDESIVTLTPIYPPFMGNPRKAGFDVIEVPLGLDDRRYIIDIDALEAAIRPDTRLLLLCNPHNPVGRAYSRAELLAVAAVAERHDLVVCSDEVHADLILDPDIQHIPFASLSDEIAQRTITLHAPSKTYNLPGLGCAFAITANPELRNRLRRASRGYGIDIPALGFAGCRAALTHGQAWLDDLLVVLRTNRDHARQRLGALPGIELFDHEATYLSWLDCRSLPVPNPYRHFLKAGVALSNGKDFAAPGFLRLNLGCPATTLDEALSRMEAAIG